MRRTSARLLRKIEGAKGALWDEVGPAQADSPFDPETVQHVRALLAELTDDGAEAEFLAVSQELLSHASELTDVAKAWIRLVEVLVQDAESRNRHDKRGTIKSGEVKWVLAYLLRTGRFQIPQVPSYLQPLAIDVVADLTINAVVGVLDDHDLKTGSPVRRVTRFAGSLRWMAHQAGRPFQGLLNWLGTQAARLYTAIRFRAKVSPAMRSALAAVEEKGLVEQEQHLFDEVSQFFNWLATHGDVVTTLARLVSLAVTETERFVHLDGPGKKAYAEGLVFTVLQDAGVGQGLIGSTLLRWGVDVAIDSFVGIFNDHKMFAHSSATASPGAGAAVVAPADGPAPATRPT